MSTAVRVQTISHSLTAGLGWPSDNGGLVGGPHVTALAVESVGCGHRGSVRGWNEVIAWEGEEVASLRQKHPLLYMCAVNEPKQA